MNEQVKHTDTLAELRAEIDGIDDRLRHAMAERVLVVDMIGQYKLEHNLPPLDERRRQQVLQQWVDEAVTLGMDGEFAREMYELIHAYSVHREERV